MFVKGVKVLQAFKNIVSLYTVCWVVPNFVLLTLYRLRYCILYNNKGNTAENRLHPKLLMWIGFALNSKEMLLFCGRIPKCSYINFTKYWNQQYSKRSSSRCQRYKQTFPDRSFLILKFDSRAETDWISGHASSKSALS